MPAKLDWPCLLRKKKRIIIYLRKCTGCHAVPINLAFRAIDEIHHPKYIHINSLTPPNGCGCNLELLMFSLISRIDTLRTSCEVALRWSSQDLNIHLGYGLVSSDKIYHLNKCCPISISPHGVTKPQWLKHICSILQRVRISLIDIWLRPYSAYLIS